MKQGVVVDILRLSRPYNSILPLLLIYTGGVLSGAIWGYIISAMILYFVCHSIVTISNDLEDIDVDADNNRNISAITALPYSMLSQAIWWASGLTVLISAASMPVMFTLLLAATFAVSWAYNAKRFRLSRRPIASIVVLSLGYAIIPFYLGLSLGVIVTSEMILLGLCLGLVRASVSILKDYKDAEGDAKHEKKTFLLVYGRTAVRTATVVLAIAGYSGVIAFLTLLLGFEGWLWIIVAVGLAVWLVYQRLGLEPKKSYKQLNDIFHKVLYNEVLFYGAIASWVTISLV